MKRHAAGKWNSRVALIFFVGLQLSLLQSARAHTNLDPDTAMNTAHNEVEDKNSNSKDESWWYESIQESYVDKLVHEFKGTSANEDQHDMFRILQPDKQSSMVVQFYSSDAADCPIECMKLRDHYLQLALHIAIITKPTMDTDHKSSEYATASVPVSVSLHAVNCANHKGFCQQQGINYFPTIRLYKHNDVSSPESSYKSLKTNTITDISFQHLHPYEVLHSLGIAAYDLPDVDSTIDTVHTPSNDQEGVVTDLKVPTNSGVHTLADGKYRHRSREELFRDIHIALDYTLSTLIFSARTMEDNRVVYVPHPDHPSDLAITEQDALKSFLLLLQKTLPSSADAVRVRAMIKAVTDNFVLAVKNHNYMDAIIKDYRPVTTQYSSHVCPISVNDESNEDIDEMNYTCAMWDILLMTSMGMVDYNNQAYDATETIHPASALHTIFDYVQVFGLLMATSTNFFPDFDPVQSQFRDLYNDCTFMNRCQQVPDAPKVIYEDDKNQESREYTAQITTTLAEWKMVPLYIASVRNMTIQQRNPNHIAVWPPTSICSVCWKLGTGDTFTSPMWNEQNFFKYLKIEYGHIDAVTNLYQHELLHDEQREVATSLLDVEVSGAKEQLSTPGNDPDDPAVPFTEPLIRPQSTSSTILTMRHGSICILFLIISVLRWMYASYVKRLGNAKSGVTEQQSKSSAVKDTSPISIENKFDNDETNDIILSRRTSPTKRQRLKDVNRKLMMEQEVHDKRKQYAKSSSFILNALEASELLDSSSNHQTKTQTTALPPLPLSDNKSTTAIYISSSNAMDAMKQLRRRKCSGDD